LACLGVTLKSWLVTEKMKVAVLGPGDFHLHHVFPNAPLTSHVLRYRYTTLVFNQATVGSRAFPVAGPKSWNALPEDVTSSQSEYTFRHQLKMWLFKKSFPDIII